MPIYEYQCQSCGHELEKIQRMSDSPLTDCPDCGKAGLRRLVSAAGFRLKGGGWYETDFKKGSKRNLHGSAETKDSSSSTEKTETGSTGKPAVTKESASKPSAAKSETT